MASQSVERRLLQSAIAILALVPVLAGGAGMVHGPLLVGEHAGVTADSHFRYLSGLLAAIGLAYWSCVPGIEGKGGRLKLLTALVFFGGLGRLVSLFSVGPPSRYHLAALAVELLVAPTLWLWQRRLAGALRPKPV